MSCSVLFSACPRCSAPVTFGGGMTIVNGLRLRVRLAVEVAALVPRTRYQRLGCGVIVLLGKVLKSQFDAAWSIRAVIE